MLHYPQINPIALQLGPLSIYWYGLMYLIGLFIANGLGRYRARKPHSGWQQEEVNDLGFYVMLGAVVGGRLGYVLFYDLSYSIQKPSSIFALWRGGMSFHGGLLGVLLALKYYAHKVVTNFWTISDFVAPLVPLALAAGRIGNFINGELWGRISNVPWAMVFPQAGPYPRHPSQLYECLGEGLFLFVLIWQYSRKSRPLGAISGLFAVGYALCRYGIEFFREPDAHLGFIAWGWLTMGQLLSLPLLLVGIGLLYRAYFRQLLRL